MSWPIFSSGVSFFSVCSTQRSAARSSVNGSRGAASSSPRPANGHEDTNAHERQRDSPSRAFVSSWLPWSPAGHARIVACARATMAPNEPGGTQGARAAVGALLRPHGQRHAHRGHRHERPRDRRPADRRRTRRRRARRSSRTIRTLVRDDDRAAARQRRRAGDHHDRRHRHHRRATARTKSSPRCCRSGSTDSASCSGC